MTTTATRAPRTVEVPVGDLQPGAVITNVFRHLTVDSVTTDQPGDLTCTTVAYHYTDDRGLRVDAMWVTRPRTTVRVLAAQ